MEKEAKERLRRRLCRLAADLIFFYYIRRGLKWHPIRIVPSITHVTFLEVLITVI
jgi:hypothetical protein